MHFRLTYHGQLPGDADARTKHGIRRRFHPQLKRLWSIYPGLDGWARNTISEGPGAGKNRIDLLADNYARNGFRFVPLVATFRKPAVPVPHVSLDILFLRSGKPGGVIKSADIDGRLKTLFDALCAGPIGGVRLRFGLARKGLGT